MKKVLLMTIAFCVAFVANAQDVPYSKYLSFNKQEFKENHFKYNDETNTWSLNKTNGLNVTLNILCIIADAEEEIRPATNDYSIVVQMGRDEHAANVYVRFYDDETYHKLLTFLIDNGQNLIETSSGKLIKHQAFYGDFSLELNMEQHIISRTSSRTADYKTVKNVDESYNEYTFIINTSVEPWSEYLEKQAAKKAKRDAKGKKKQSIDELM
ncbi:MAG: hypothetical protein IKU16_04580 [Muribaculaceae bacterium]|nr:hypothetical protein [Muribaculaceae bacterium]